MVTTIFQSFKCKEICGKIVFYQSGWPRTKIKAMLHHVVLKKKRKKKEKIQNYGFQMAYTDLFTAYWKLNICIDLFLVEIQPGHNLYSSQTWFTLTKVNGSPRIFQLVTVNQMIVLCLYQYVKCDMLLTAVIKKLQNGTKPNCGFDGVYLHLPEPQNAMCHCTGSVYTIKPPWI